MYPAKHTNEERISYIVIPATLLKCANLNTQFC